MLVVAVTAVALVAKEETESKGLKIGDVAPMTDVKMKNAQDGEMVSIADVTGEKGTLVVFSCNHCPFVVAWEGRMVALGNEYRKKGVGVVFVNANDPARVPGDSFEAMARRVKEKGYEFPYVVDGTSNLARAYGASRTPECFLFDAKGKLAYHGGIDDNHRDADAVTKITDPEDLMAVHLASLRDRDFDTYARLLDDSFRYTVSDDTVDQFPWLEGDSWDLEEEIRMIGNMMDDDFQGSALPVRRLDVWLIAARQEAPENGVYEWVYAIRGTVLVGEFTGWGVDAQLAFRIGPVENGYLRIREIIEVPSGPSRETGGASRGPGEELTWGVIKARYRDSPGRGFRDAVVY